MRAIALFSGGLDSMLACRLVAEQGIEVIAINFNFGFSKGDKREYFEKAAEQAHAKLEILDIHDDYVKEVLFDPAHGYGSAFNPCIDCHGHMFKQAGRLLEKFDAQFLISGEVIGERPMSQNPKALETVKQISGYEDLIVRPLSAKLLEPTKPELEGWIDREKLLDFSGRGRKRQLDLAKEYGFEIFESPGGGCLLTESFFDTKMKDFLEHDTYSKEDNVLLKFGRHFRLPDGAKLVLGRNQDENERFKAQEGEFTKYFFVRQPDELFGPISLLSKNASDADKRVASKIIITYARSEFPNEYTVTIGEDKIIESGFKSKEDCTEFMLGAQ